MNTKKLLALITALIMVLALIPTVGGAKTERPLSESEREVKAARLMSFTEKVAQLTNTYDKDIDTRGDGEFALCRIIVKSTRELTSENAVASISGYNDWHVFQYATAGEAEAACKQFKAMDGVEWAEPDEIMTVQATPGTNSFNSWGFGAAHVNAYEYNQWLYNYYGNSVDNMPTVVVAVVDTGADQDHPYLVSRLVPGYNIVDDNNNPEDGHSHGTHVCGTVVDGTFANVKVMPIKVLSDSGYGTTLQVVLGMEYGYLHGADVENLSLGGTCDNASEHYMMAEVIDSAYSNGTTVCVAAGNDSTDAASFCPANVERACTVAATTSSKTLAYFSNYGAVVDVAAPGENIYSSVPGGGYGNKSGTSMACPHVAAVAAQIKTFNPAMSADDVVSVIKGAAIDIGLANAGTGLLHLAADMYGLDPAANGSGEYNHFFSSGNYAWTVDGASVVSGNAGVNSSTSVMTCEVSVGLNQYLDFCYRVSSEEGRDFLRIKANGETIFEASGNEEDQTSVVIPGSGSVTLTFEYSKDSSGSAGSDKAWIWGVRVSNSISSAANLTGGTVDFTSEGDYRWVADETEHAARSTRSERGGITSTMNATISLEKAMIVVFEYKVDAASGGSFTFKDNGRNVFSSGATEGYVSYEYSVPATGSHEFSFVFTKSAEGPDAAFVKCFYYYHSFESAVNGTDDFLPFDNETDYPWFVMNDSVASSNWGENSTQSYFTLTLEMNAQETLTFQYRSSSEANYDYFRFYVDGVKKTEQSGNNTNWSTYTFTATSNKTYTFKWSFEKDSSVEYYDDCAYVRNVIYSGTYAPEPNGDVNHDGVVDSLDALLVLRYAMQLIGEDALDLQMADINGDGVVNSVDALEILRMAMGN